MHVGLCLKSHSDPLWNATWQSKMVAFTSKLIATSPLALVTIGTVVALRQLHSWHDKAAACK
jgi:hypothetical protein